ncbi:MAG TPA: hypothetical protein VFK13_05680 [Gemmatimonadaceae bacterium]|nr:hypothetical protein [Gemmatimonadaceae bacterium]
MTFSTAVDARSTTAPPTRFAPSTACSATALATRVTRATGDVPVRRLAGFRLCAERVADFLRAVERDDVDLDVAPDRERDDVPERDVDDERDERDFRALVPRPRADVRLDGRLAVEFRDFFRARLLVVGMARSRAIWWPLRVRTSPRPQRRVAQDVCASRGAGTGARSTAAPAWTRDGSERHVPTRIAPP